jgi:hypothetical protein
VEQASTAPGRTVKLPLLFVERESCAPPRSLHAKVA